MSLITQSVCANLVRYLGPMHRTPGGEVMDISAANTEASFRFHRAHERLNISIKVQMIGLGLLADEIDSGSQPAELKERLYRRKGWLWGGMPDWTNPRSIITAARRDIGQAGVVRAFSAFDLFMDEIASDL